jgi:hypothetical protein
MGVGIGLIGGAVRRPAGMGYAKMRRRQRMAFDKSCQIIDLAGYLAHMYL